jgi:hypothetical protein
LGAFWQSSSRSSTSPSEIERKISRRLENNHSFSDTVLPNRINCGVTAPQNRKQGRRPETVGTLPLVVLGLQPHGVRSQCNLLEQPVILSSIVSDRILILLPSVSNQLAVCTPNQGQRQWQETYGVYNIGVLLSTIPKARTIIQNRRKNNNNMLSAKTSYLAGCSCTPTSRGIRNDVRGPCNRWLPVLVKVLPLAIFHDHQCAPRNKNSVHYILEILESTGNWTYQQPTKGYLVHRLALLHASRCLTRERIALLVTSKRVLVQGTCKAQPLCLYKANLLGPCDTCAGEYDSGYIITKASIIVRKRATCNNFPFTIIRKLPGNLGLRFQEFSHNWQTQGSPGHSHCHKYCGRDIIQSEDVPEKIIMYARKLPDNCKSRLKISWVFS